MQRTNNPVGRWRANHFVGNHPALDFVNTISDRVSPAGAVDRLQSLDDLVTWAQSAGLIDPTIGASRFDAGGAAADGESAARARRLREAGHTVFTHRAEDRSPPPDALAHIAGVAAQGTAAGGLQWAGGDGPAALTRTSTDGLLGLIAWQMLDALFRVPDARLGICPRCGWLFHDDTKGGRRRWCSMDMCGNREKARRHRRSRSGGSHGRQSADQRASGDGGSLD